jgi:hypothetical protein
MRPTRAKRERGAALLALLAVLLLGASWLLVSQLNAESGGVTAVNRAHNSAALNRAKQALIGYIATQAAESEEKYPGRLPCPEGVNSIGTSSEGIAAPWVGPPNTATCNSIGRLPWRTLGLDKLVDSAGEPLWYVVGPTWRLTTSSSTLLINSNTTGDTTLDGQQVVALIIAPGAAIDAQAATGCTAKTQSRSAPAPAMDASNYIECFNSSTLQFVTNSSSSIYNDQTVSITVADIMPAIEAIVANRIERQILPGLQTMFTPATWGLAGTNPVLPFAAPFVSPGYNTGSGSNVGTSNFQGVAATYQGLLPFNQTQGCTESASDPRCTTTLMAWSSSGPVQSGGSGSIRTGEASFPNTCSWQTADIYSCIGAYNTPTVTLDLTVTVTNVAMGLRKLDLSKLTFTAENDVACSPCWSQQTVPYTVSVTMNSNGSATISIVGTPLPDIVSAEWGTWATYKISFDRAFIGDHALLSSTDSTTGWFVRNEWYRHLYYAVSPSNTAARLAATTPAERSCSLVGDCLSVTTNSTASSKSALLILAGRSLNAAARPSATLSDYLEFGNANSAFESRTVTTVSPAPLADSGAADAYVVAGVSPVTGTSFQFKALSANTGGASTLTTVATGTRTLVNLDGSSLAASTISANAVVQVLYDGTRFLLLKQPFNDRIVASGSN